MTRLFPATRRLAAGAVLAVSVLVAAALAGVGSAGRSIHVSHNVDTGLCPFTLDVTVTSKATNAVETTVRQFRFAGPSKITLRNASTGRAATLLSSGSHSVDTTTGSVAFQGHQVWFWSTGKNVPFLSTDGKGALKAPNFVISGARARAQVIDPCALVAAARPSTRPVTTKAPWGLPRYQLSQIGYAHLTPILGALIRHDHVHLDVIVNGRRVTIPAGVGQAEPADAGPCPPGPRIGDCSAPSFFAAKVANSPLHNHSTSGIIHIESDRSGTFTLGEFFDEWGVRFDSRCVGGYCTGGGKELRVYVDGKRVPGDPRGIALTNRQELAVVFGGPGDFRSVPLTYAGGWPGLGCGGPGEHSCLPR